ncbi:penicillin acylase family protein [Hyphococcus luteus]|uniref:Penicillin amidase n=1 Tax=Hyphococcus luteus TaxID=2058213 RepID=A0A2S7K2F7_9PROT|nr:penicillin acylase family protein [Marinicaulis flavus]PQA86680.1 penicillin amidase [Marinicaulis flavus]
MLKILKFGGLALLVILAGAALYLKTPAPAPFDAAAAREAAKAFDARIIRDAFGVPHIYGARDADVAFGLAYAHAEDDWKTIETVILFSRGDLARRDGEDAAVTDYLIRAMGAGDDIAERYETDLVARTRALAEAYAAGINFYCAEDRARCTRDALPVKGEDVVAGFAARQPFFYGLDNHLKKLFDGEVDIEERAATAREAFLKVPAGFETGSNAIAVAPVRSADGHTRLMVNSHQPYTGPVAWYEARVKSEEGWDMIGGIFPGSPVILHGAGPDLGWAFTVNKPDLVDAYKLEVDDPKKPSMYRFDGGWREFDVKEIKFRVKLWGPFSLPVTRRALTSVHGPVFETDKGWFAVSYAGRGEIRALEQYYRMNRASDYAEWRAAMEMLALPSLNAVYADGDGVIAYYYNAAIPKRAAGPDWSKAQDGSDPALVWAGKRTLNDVPQVVMPLSGYVVNANHTPFQSSGPEDNPDPADFPPHYGVDRRTTNRGLREQALYGGDPSITSEDFVAYKIDHVYAENSRVMELVRDLAAGDAADLEEERAVLAAWDGAVTKDSRSAALAVLTAQRARGTLLNDEDVETPDYETALRDISAELKEKFGRIDPTWGEAVRLKRGDLSLPLNGGPDTLRAVYPERDGEGPLKAVGGDTYILYADWSGARDVEIKTIHQFGSATLDETSPHYADQAPIFAAEEWKEPPMELEALFEEATRDYRVGGE